MSDPYEVLGLPADADEAEVRRRYLALVREFPPDRAPERFAAIRGAYEELRDPTRRLATQLFESARTDTIDAIVADVRDRLGKARLTPEIILSLAEAS